MMKTVKKESNNKYSGKLKYRSEIDGLRGLAIIPVVLFHTNFKFFDGGYIGVDIFFVISGFLITMILINDVEKRQFTLTSFYERRARRILPALYLVVFCSLIFSYFVLVPEHLVSLAKSATSVPLFVSNFFFWSERGYFNNAAELKPLIHTWSLAVEEQFYIIFPLFISLLYLGRKKILLTLMIIIFLLSLFASFYVTTVHFSTAFFLPFTRAWEILIGCFVAFYINTNKKESKVEYKVNSELISLLGLGLIIYAYATFDKSTLFPYISALLPTLGTAMIIVGTEKSIYVKGLLSNRFLVYIGLLGYSLYLIHQPVFVFARHMYIFEGNELALVFISLILAYFSYKFIETPFRRKDFFSSKFVWHASLFGALIIIVVSFSQIYSKGFPNRFDEKDQGVLLQLAEYQGYNQRAFDKLKYKEFDEFSEKKILLIGGSHAKDFLNIILESKMFKNYSFSTRQVNSECGNLYLKDYTIIEKFIPERRKARCKLLGRYEGKKFISILDDSDEIWLVSSWKDWNTDYLPLSLENLNKDFKKTVRVFGLKNFGYMSSRKAINIDSSLRPNYVQSVTEDISTAEKRMSEVLKDYEFYYPLMDLMCGGDRNACRIYNSNGLLISPDGSHLTKEGAIEMSINIRPLLETLSSIR